MRVGEGEGPYSKQYEFYDVAMDVARLQLHLPNDTYIIHTKLGLSKLKMKHRVAHDGSGRGRTVGSQLLLQLLCERHKGEALLG